MSFEAKTAEQLLGDVIRSRREYLNFSQENLASECGFHRTYISQLERGQKSPTLRTLIILAKALKMEPADLIKQATQDFT